MRDVIIEQKNNTYKSFHLKNKDGTISFIFHQWTTGEWWCVIHYSGVFTRLLTWSADEVV